MLNCTKHRLLDYVLVLSLALWHTALGAASPCPPVATMPTPAQLQKAQQHAQDRGALWRFEKDGRDGYLYGTIHVGNLEGAMLGPTVSRALRQTEIIAMELDPTDPAVQQGMTAPQTPQETPELPDSLWSRLRTQAIKACVPWERLHAMPPMKIALTLAMLDARWEGLDPSYAGEFVLAGFAKATGKEVALLETVSIQRNALMGGSLTEQTTAIERIVSDLETGVSRERIRAMAEAWAQGDLDRLEHYRDDIVWKRNPGIATRIEELHQRGRRVFAAAGILHMIGKHALPQLLAERGFTVKRVVFGSP